jgi:predicted AAA+ superfamily ATPase
MKKLIELHKRLLSTTNCEFVRYLHDEVNWNARLIGITGARGTGKTTLLLQHIKLHLDMDTAIYVNVEDTHFSENRLFDLAEMFYKHGRKHLFIDEVHKYPNWTNELIMLYDNFPDMQIVYTSSSILEIYNGNEDLNLSGLSYHLAGLSFREYLMMSQKIQLPVYSLESILLNQVQLPVRHPLPFFKKYLHSGFYPFCQEPEYEQRVQNVLNQSIETDIPVYTRRKKNTITRQSLKQLLDIIAQRAPFQPNIRTIASMAGIRRNSIEDCLYYMEKVGLIMQLKKYPDGIRVWEKIEKIYLSNPNLKYILSPANINPDKVRETFFVNQMSVNNTVYLSKKANFVIDGFTFKIRKNKERQKQIFDMCNMFYVKDDTEYGYTNVLPLWTFGFNY